MCGSLEKSEPRCFWPGRLRKKMDDGQTCTVRRTQSLRPCGLALGELGRTNLSGSTNYWFVHVCSGVYHGILIYIYIYHYIYMYIYIIIYMYNYIYMCVWLCMYYIYRTGFSTKQLSYWCLKWQSSSNIFHKSLDFPGPPGPIGLPHDSALTCCNYIICIYIYILLYIIIYYYIILFYIILY